MSVRFGELCPYEDIDPNTEGKERYESIADRVMQCIQNIPE